MAKLTKKQQQKMEWELALKAFEGVRSAFFHIHMDNWERLKREHNFDMNGLITYSLNIFWDAINGDIDAAYRHLQVLNDFMGNQRKAWKIKSLEERLKAQIRDT